LHSSTNSNTENSLSKKFVRTSSGFEPQDELPYARGTVVIAQLHPSC
jgi:hypothetical protein